MVLAFSIGSAFAAEPVEQMSIMPQNVQPMDVAELDSVRGMWGGLLPDKSQALAKGNTPFTDAVCPPGFHKRAGT